ncbi:hypothetical protein [Alistipes ihumii]|uniref:hypothetical protein n=1 Tax=Alistipes ihumii TaxID=1470347 RepID=UPI003AB11D8C
MKKWLILLVCLSSGAYAPAAPDSPFEDDYYAEYMDGDYDDLYKYGFRMNNYASVYSDRFVVSLAREYGMPRADLRYYLRKGYSPSDLLFGLELSRRAGRSLRRIMELYYGSPDRNWTVVSIRLGLGPGSPAFGLILDRFRSQCRFWEDYYVRRNPHRHPPLYKHSWSYFRPHAPHGRPARPHLGPFHPGPVRMPRGEQASPPVPGKVRRNSGRKPRTPDYRRGGTVSPEKRRPIAEPARGTRPLSPPRPSRAADDPSVSRPGPRGARPAADRPKRDGYRRGGSSGARHVPASEAKGSAAETNKPDRRSYRR